MILDMTDSKDESKKTLYSVGEEFVAWANKSWDLTNKYKSIDGEESVDISPYFIEKINSLIKDNLRYGGLIE